ncbi:hypothetical protein F2Q69_00049507 [Brassica cretica]|uniref:Uncharacterized protein n=1 Tax=Brassica cretica TaxID=69181 RepID=A0A8S9PIU3_BRACR|nr:hypothetical protein F2Q69_00049507 [Brassica cretica]
MGQDLRRLSIKALGVFRSVQKYPNELGDGAEIGSSIGTDGTDGTYELRAINHWRYLDGLCKNRARYVQAVRTIDCTSPGNDQKLCKLREMVQTSIRQSYPLIWTFMDKGKRV